jgi:hypothetical protein
MGDEKEKSGNGAGSNGTSNLVPRVGSFAALVPSPSPPHENEPEPAPPDPAPAPPLEAPPARVTELAAAAMRFVAAKYKVALDGTPDTMSLVDQYVRDAWPAVKERPESLDLVAPALGAYLGEVMRQSLAQARGHWETDGDLETWRLWFENVYLAFNPIGMAREALLVADADGWNAHLQLDPAEREEIDARLQVIGDVDEEEYYLPTTRLEIVTLVVETLRARAEQAGMADVAFTRDDYE